MVIMIGLLPCLRGGVWWRVRGCRSAGQQIALQVCGPFSASLCYLSVHIPAWHVQIAERLPEWLDNIILAPEGGHAIEQPAGSR